VLHNNWLRKQQKMIIKTANEGNILNFQSLAYRLCVLAGIVLPNVELVDDQLYALPPTTVLA